MLCNNIVSSASHSREQVKLKIMRITGYNYKLHCNRLRITIIVLVNRRILGLIEAVEICIWQGVFSSTGYRLRRVLYRDSEYRILKKSQLSIHTPIFLHQVRFEIKLTYCFTNISEILIWHCINIALSVESIRTANNSTECGVRFLCHNI